MVTCSPVTSFRLEDLSFLDMFTSDQFPPPWLLFPLLPDEDRNYIRHASEGILEFPPSLGMVPVQGQCLVNTGHRKERDPGAWSW